VKREIYLPDEYYRAGISKKRKRRNRICAAAAVLAGILMTGSVMRAQQTEAKMQETQKDLAEEVFRFHVLANSDSEEDQALKMKVKEEVLSYMKAELPDAQNAEETKEWARENLQEIEQAARAVVWEEGYGYEVNAQVTKCDFPDKSYGDVVFPAGRYEALRIEIGEAKGHNWWCVLYPNLCFIDSVHAIVPEEGKEELRQVLSEDEYEMVTMGTDFKIKWFFFGDKE